MKFNKRVLLAYVCVTLFIFAGVGEAQSDVSQSLSAAGFSITIRPFTSQMALGSNVAIAIRVTNISTAPITLLFGGYRNKAAGFHYDVRDAHGNSLKRVRQTSGLRPTRSPGSEIRGEELPGKSIEEATTLSDIFQFDKPGENTIQVSRKEPGMPIVSSNIVTVTMLQKSESTKSSQQ